MEEHLFIQNKDKRLFISFYTPSKQNSQKVGFIICHPFEEEKKATQNFITNIGKDLALKGYYACVFDFNGCGESEGYLKDATVTSWCNDVLFIQKEFKNRYQLDEINLLGIRFGAYIGLVSVQMGLKINKLVVIEPVFDGIKYIRKTLRSKYIKEIIGLNKKVSSDNEIIENLSTNKIIDFNGYELSSVFFNDLALVEEQKDFKIISDLDISIAMIKISVRGHLDSESARIIDFFAEQGKTVEHLLFNELPFWVSHSPKNHTTLRNQVVELSCN